jgi:malonate decarboxylase beta subunit
MAKFDVDFFVIGGGSGGVRAARIAAEHAMLRQRLDAYGDCRDGVEIWRRQGIADADALPLLDTAAFLAAVADRSP